MNKLLLGTLLGAGLALAGVYVVQSGRYLAGTHPPSVAALHKPLTPMAVDPTWVRSGTPNFRAAETAKSPIDQSLSGLWAADGPSSFQWTFTSDETVHILEGRVEVDYLGQRFVLQPGDSAVFHAGTQAVWVVPEKVKKSFTLHHPNRLVRLWRQGLQALGMGGRPQVQAHAPNPGQPRGH